MGGARFAVDSAVKGFIQADVKERRRISYVQFTPYVPRQVYEAPVFERRGVAVFLFARGYRASVPDVTEGVNIASDRHVYSCL